MLAPFSMSNLRLPLQAAMTLSPVSLLANMSLNIHAVSESKLCQVSTYLCSGVSQQFMIRYLQIWRNLGGNWPHLLRSAELQIWSIIWDHATSTIDLRARLRETLSNLTEDVSRSTEREALNWFSESEYQILSYRKPRELKL